MLFAVAMKKFCILLTFVSICSIISSCDNEHNKDEFSGRVKIALRSAGNQLLLTNNDSTSLVLPVMALTDSKYKLSFEAPVSLEPNSLVSVIETSFKKSVLPKKYRVEVINCVDEEVAYSYEMSNEKESTIIPCLERVLPKACYIIEVQFTGLLPSKFNGQTIIIIIGTLILLTLMIIKFRSKHKIRSQESKAYTKIGAYKFYADQNKLIKEAVEISLSQKECELLEIFVSRPNEVIKRDELSKRVWEDKGVIVGRSLDTYISKLRKKLKDDNSIQLINVHGVGYKLEVNK